MRTKKSFYNAISNTFVYIIRAILMFIVRIIFIRTLGKIYLGVDSLFTNLLLVLSIADSGMSVAISYTLYKPLSEKNYGRISNLMSFYKKVYRILGFLVIGFGLLFIPFLNVFIKDKIDNIYLYYLIYLITTAIPYFISYKDALLNADQNRYLVTNITSFTYIIMYILRIIFLICIPNFLIYCLIQFIMILVQRILINNYISKQYNYINFDSKDVIKKEEKDKIYKSVFSVFTNELGRYLVNATDNIIISSIPKLGLGVVAVYTNYYSIIGMIDTIIYKALSGITASFGDLAVNESKDTQENVFNIINYISNFIYGLFAVGFSIVLSLFIKICFGSDFELDYVLTILISFNFFLMGMVRPLDIIKEATGNYVKDRYLTLIQAFINVILSIIFGKIFGLIGVIVSTSISYILLPVWNRPYIAYKYIFNKKPFSYFFKELLYLSVIILIYFVSNYICGYIVISNNIILFIVKIIIITLLYTIIFNIIFIRSIEFKYLFNSVKNRINKKAR